MIRLEHTRGHNKFYELHLIKSSGRIIVKGLYGAIGQCPKEHPVYDGDNEQEALAEMQKKQLEKQKKGYVLVGGESEVAQPAVHRRTDLPVIWPMNAQGIKDEEHLNRLICNDSYAAQEKLDGMRAIIHITKNGLRIFSRSAGVADPTKPLEKTDSLPHLAALRFPQLANTILDAEILAPGVDVASLTGAIHSNEVGTTNGLVKAYVFDILSFCGEDLSSKTQHQRIAVLDVLKSRLHSPYVVFLHWVFTAKDKRSLYDNVLENGGEGILLKRLDAHYVQGGRPANNWFKAKKSATFDCVVMGFTKGMGKYNTCIGALVFGQYVDGKLTELGQASGMTDTERNDMSLHPDRYIGKVVVIKGMERLKSGAIRHPQFAGMRQDKDRFECRWYSNEQ